MPIKKKVFIKRVPVEKAEKEIAASPVIVAQSRTTIFLNNLLGGIAWGLGATIGVSIVLTILGFVLNTFNLLPFLRHTFPQVAHYFPGK